MASKLMNDVQVVALALVVLVDVEFVVGLTVAAVVAS